MARPPGPAIDAAGPPLTSDPSWQFAPLLPPVEISTVGALDASTVATIYSAEPAVCPALACPLPPVTTTVALWTG